MNQARVGGALARFQLELAFNFFTKVVVFVWKLLLFAWRYPFYLYFSSLRGAKPRFFVSVLSSLFFQPVDPHSNTLVCLSSSSLSSVFPIASTVSPPASSPFAKFPAFPTRADLSPPQGTASSVTTYFRPPPVSIPSQKPRVRSERGRCQPVVFPPWPEQAMMRPTAPLHLAK